VGYQWQVSIAGGPFTSIIDNANYSGTTSITLGLNNLPTTWTGNQYRCVVNGINSNGYTLLFKNYWNGTTSTAWENIANWSCGMLPDENTDVVVTNAMPFNLILNSNTTVKSVTVKSPASLTVSSGFNLIIKPTN